MAAKDSLEKQIETQREAQAEKGRAMSAATGQVYQEIDQVPLSDEAIAQAEAQVEASEASHEGLDVKVDKTDDK
jgi:hypothetical protein